MTSKRQLEQLLAAVAGFDRPRVDLEQYQTPAEIAAQMVHLAALRDDLPDRTAFDLGTGTGIFAIGAAARGAGRVIGIDRDLDALEIARRNAARLVPRCPISWLHGDVFRHPLRAVPDAVVFMNPPFGAQHGNRHADRQFLAVARQIGAVSYSIHNAGSADFVTAYVDDAGGAVTDAFALTMALPRQFDFHSAEDHRIQAECFRITWPAVPDRA